MLNRRTFLATASASMISPPLAWSRQGKDRKFLFIFADGGWDTTKVFTPMFGHANVDMDEGATEANENGITFTDSALRPAVRTFFETHGSRVCVINAIEVPEITHARCRRLAFTGVADAERDDWGARLGAKASGSLVAPYLAPLGTSFTQRHASRGNTAHDARVALDCFERGISRCAFVRSGGWRNAGWDTHADNDVQDLHFEELFGCINGVMADLDSRTAKDGSPLSEQVTVVVMSEMGRAPKRNALGGRDHWKFTSAMLIGSGIRGGQVVGEMDDGFRGRPVDLLSGEATDAGTRLTPGHLGATLLALGDIDPGSEGVAEQPIAAVVA